MRGTIILLLIGLCVLGMHYIASKSEPHTVIKVEPEKLGFAVEPKPICWHPYPQYYSFKDMLIRIDAPVNGVSKVTIEKRGEYVVQD